MASKELILPAGVRSVDLATRSANMPTRLSRTNKAPASRGRSARAVNEDPFAEVGTSGLKQYGGFVLEEWLVTLRGRKGAWAYREMMDNSPIAGGIIFAIKMLAKQVEWRVEDDVEDEFVFSCMNDMSHTWGDFVSEALSMIGYGWSFHETVYKRRNGGDPLPENLDDQAIDNYGSVNSEEDDVPPSSQYKDGKIGWRRLPVRAQETLMRWEFSGYSTLRGMEQIDWHGGRHNISIQKALLFRTETTRNNPEGRSLLRNAWTSYFAVKNIQAIEAIGIERDLAGIPYAIPPDGVDLSLPSNSPLLEIVQALVTGIRRDEDEGFVLPQHGWEVGLLSTGGSRQIDTDQIIRRYENRMTTSVLADFLMIGQDSVGSYAMVDVKAELFGVAVDAILDLICEVMNRYAIPRLLALNGMKPAKMPRIAHSSAGRIDLRLVGEFLTNLSLAGAQIPWTEKMMEHLFRAGGLPEPDFTGPKLPTALPSPTAHDSQWRPAWGSEDTPSEAPAPAAPVDREHVAKAGRPEGAGETIHLAPVLAERAGLLALQLEREILSALDQLGNEAGSAYMAVAQKSMSPSELQRLVGRVISQAKVGGWVRQRLTPLLQNHAGRVTLDTARVVSQRTGQRVQVPESGVQRVRSAAGRRLKVRDIEPQVREAVTNSILEGFRAGESPVKTAQRIRQAVPKGRFVNAGVPWRARLISQDQTAALQREAALAAYGAMDDVDHVEVVDGVYGPPRSDQQCMDRNGEIVPIASAATEAPSLHVGCTLSFNPIVANGVLPERELLAA